MGKSQATLWKEKFLHDERALNQTEAASILGCEPRKVDEQMQPSFYSGAKPKYIAREVLKVRDRKVDDLRRLQNRNARLIQDAQS